MSVVTPLGKYDDTRITRGKKSRTIAEIIADAQTAATSLFVIATVEVILLIMHGWFASGSLALPEQPIIPEDPTDVTPTLDERTLPSMAAAICLHLFYFVWFAPVTLYIDLIFWRYIQKAIPVFNIIMQLVAGAALVISLGYAIHLASVANTAAAGPNVMNDPYYCCVFWNSSTSGCLNYGHRCGEDMPATELHISTGGAVHIAMSAILIVVIIGVNLTFFHTTFVGTHYDLIVVEGDQFKTKPNLQYKRVNRGLVGKIGKVRSSKPKSDDDVVPLTSGAGAGSGSGSDTAGGSQFVLPMNTQL
jgi:hypothetical protein